MKLSPRKASVALFLVMFSFFFGEKPRQSAAVHCLEQGLLRWGNGENAVAEDHVLAA